MQTPSVPFRSNSTQVADTVNQNMPPYQNQRVQQTVQQDGHLVHLTATAYQGGLVAPIPRQLFYQGEQSTQGKFKTAFVMASELTIVVDSTLQLEGHQRLLPQEQQRQEQEQQQGQEQEEEQPSVAGLGDFNADEMGNEFYREFLFQYDQVH